MTTLFEKEIREQPEVWDRLLGASRAAVEAAAASIRRFAPAFVVTAARGSSDNAARYAKYLLGSRNRLVVSLGAPSLVTVYESPPDLSRAVTIGISQSGESPDIVALLAEARRQNGLTVALTNQPGSPLAQVAEQVIDLQAGPEQAVAATKSYTTELLALAMLSTALERNASAREPAWSALHELPDQARETLSLNSKAAIGAIANGLVDAAHLMVVGRGFNFSTAFETALKITETCGLMANPFAAPDLFHGPLAGVAAELPALVVAPRGESAAGMRDTMEQLAARGARLHAISNDETVALGSNGATPLLFSRETPEWLSPLVAIVPAQLLALMLAERRGLDPDRPRGLSKVTRTR